MLDTDYADLLLAQQPAKPRNREELAEMTALLETLAASETVQSPAMERFIETLTARVLQYEEEVEPGPDESTSGVLRHVMEERALRQADLVPILGRKSYVSQILSGYRPISKVAAGKLAEFFPGERVQFSSAELGSNAGLRCRLLVIIFLKSSQQWRWNQIGRQR